ncbi:MAG: FecCD family ABC transporter permease [Silvanigrellaceae bacterium]
MKAIIFCAAVWFILVIVGFVLGPATPTDFWIRLWKSGEFGPEFLISQSSIFELRLVHVLLASATGFALATAGRSLQHLLQNPLADPHVVGLSAGSTTFVLLTILFAPAFAQQILAGWFPALWLSALLGSLFALFLLRVFLFKLVRHWGGPALALAGLFLNAGFAAVLMVIFARLSPAGLSEVQNWTLGAIQPYGVGQSLFLLPPLLISSIWLMSRERSLLLLSFGQDFALTNGVGVVTLRAQILIALAILCASAVCAAGSVGFVGLLVPHLTKYFLSGSRPLWVRPVFNGFAGAGVLLAADVMSRNLTPPMELPVGVYTALLSVPSLALLLMREKGRA